MSSLSQAKALGGIGSILILLSIVPTAGVFLAVVGFILTLISVKFISDSLQDSSIFSNILIAVVLAIIGVVIGGVVVFGSVLRFIGLRNISAIAPGSTTPVVSSNIFGLVAGILTGLVVVWIMLIIAAYFQRKSYDVIATRLNTGTFRTAALLYLIGAALTIILVGFLLLFVAEILFIVAFFSIPEAVAPASVSVGSTQMPPPSSAVPPTAGTKFCTKCGARLDSAASFCSGCGASQSQ